MRALIIQQDHVSPPGPIGSALETHGYELHLHEVVPAERHLTPTVVSRFPNPADFDLIVPMGAPWSVYDEALLGSWLAVELAMLRSAVASSVPVLGICFGGQALAAALGGRVKPASKAEIGWTTLQTARPDIVAAGPWFEWHGDQWEAPASAEPLAWTEVCEQAFTIGNSLAVQFHPEMTPSMLAGWLANGGDAYLGPLGIDAESLVAATDREAESAADRARRLVDGFLRHIAPRVATGL